MQNMILRNLKNAPTPASLTEYFIGGNWKIYRDIQKQTWKTTECTTSLTANREYVGFIKCWNEKTY